MRTRADAALWTAGARGAAPALIDGDRVVTYADLERQVEDLRRRLGTTRRLVLLRAANDLDTVVGLLACLTGRHPVLLTPPCGPSDAVLTYDPDVTLHAGALTEHRSGTAHDLHPDLALLLSTSGSTGSPKLVRLSLDSLRSNAEAIAAYLGLDERDRGITSLPLQYCYGLSILTSHLVVGASVTLTDASVTEERFWDAMSGVTSLAGVPHTFDLLEQTGFERHDLPSLRTITQAGGRLAPHRVRAWAQRCQRRGVDFVVMYGQTEATARMGYLPPHLAADRPECVGVPVPGSTWRIDDGELVFAGPGVMLGYAETAADLARGREVHELRTGDLAVEHDDGLVEIIGRRSRFAKVFGLRIDLARLEEAVGVPARAVEHDGRVALFVRRHRDVAPAQAAALDAGLPLCALTTHVIADFPLTANGKPDHAALVRQAALAAETSGPGPHPVEGVTADVLRDELALLLGRPDARLEDSFVSLGGDSLSYVEAATRLDRLLGGLPDGWPQLSCTELAGATARGSRLEVPVLLRALAIVLIVATHADVIDVAGGAHVLLAVAGFQLARFGLAREGRLERARGLLRSAAAVALPAGLFIAIAGAVTGMYAAPTALFLNNAIGSRSWTDDWQFWFLEVVVWVPVLLAGVLAIPVVDRAERAHPWGFALGALGVTAALRFALAGLEAGNPQRYALPVVACFVAVGWVAARATTPSRRLVAVLAAAGVTVGFFGDLQRELVVVAGIALLACVRTVPSPAYLLRPVAAIASASLWIYLTHWQVYPHLEDDHPVLATLASLVVGLLAWQVWTRLSRRASQIAAARRYPDPVVASSGHLSRA